MLLSDLNSSCSMCSCAVPAASPSSSGSSSGGSSTGSSTHLEVHIDHLASRGGAAVQAHLHTRGHAQPAGALVCWIQASREAWRPAGQLLQALQAVAEALQAAAEALQAAAAPTRPQPYSRHSGRPTSKFTPSARLAVAGMSASRSAMEWYP